MVLRDCRRQHFAQRVCLISEELREVRVRGRVNGNQYRRPPEGMHDYLEVGGAECGERLLCERELGEISTFEQRIIREDVIPAGAAEAVPEKDVLVLPRFSLCNGLFKSQQVGNRRCHIETLPPRFQSCSTTGLGR